jgi:hypothetical protein
VANAFATNTDCAGLLGGQFAALGRLSEASFNYAANAKQQPNWNDQIMAGLKNLASNPTDSTTGLPIAAGTVTVNGVNTNVTFLNDNFFSTTNASVMATTLIHELMHQAGAGTEIDGANYKENYADIRSKCSTQ